MSDKISDSKKVVLTQCAQLQWLAMALLSTTILSGFIVFQLLINIGLDWDFNAYVILFFIITFIAYGGVYEWYNSTSSSFWGRSFKSALEHVISNHEQFDEKEIQYRTGLLIASIILCSISFLVGLLFDVTHHWLSFFVPVFASVIGSGAIEEIVYKSTKKTWIMVIPACIVFSVVFGISWLFTSPALPNSLQFVLSFGAWVSNGFLGAFLLYGVQRLVMRRYT
ncbi:hypothetical protein [Vibrio alginolyticus]|uniref:hypothetical protein n=1 Tax=Vibrio alginolyticus TaxID=663 RepID=UPI003264D9C3